jgi:hypothetical protein
MLHHGLQIYIFIVVLNGVFLRGENLGFKVYCVSSYSIGRMVSDNWKEEWDVLNSSPIGHFTAH